MDFEHYLFDDLSAQTLNAVCAQAIDTEVYKLAYSLLSRLLRVCVLIVAEI